MRSQEQRDVERVWGQQGLTGGLRNRETQRGSGHSRDSQEVSEQRDVEGFLDQQGFIYRSFL